MRDVANRIIHVPRRFVAHEWGGTETVLAEMAGEQLSGDGGRRFIRRWRSAKCGQEICRDIPVRRYGYCYPFLGLDAAERAQLDKKGGNLISLGLFRALACASGVRLYHAHTLKRMGGEVFTAARMRRKAFVVTLHGGVFDVPAAERAEMAGTQAGHLEWGKIFGLVFRSRRILEEADAVICVGYRGVREGAGGAVARAGLPFGERGGRGAVCEGGRGGVPEEAWDSRGGGGAGVL